MHRCRHRRFRLGAQCIALAVAAFVPASLEANELSSERLLQATTSQEAKKEAVRAIPLGRVGQTHRRDVQRVLADSSLYRRLPMGVVACDPDMFTFLMRHPEMLVEIWRELGISRVDMQRVDANNFRLNDNVGTTAQLSIVEEQCEPGAQNRIIMYAEGAYEGKPFKRAVRAQCVLLLRSGSFEETDGKKYVAARLDTFVRIDRNSIKLFAKAMHPWVGKTADANFMDTLSFISNLSQASTTNLASVEKLVLKLPRISPQLQQEMLSIARRSGRTLDRRATIPRVARAEKK
ncbi:MAG: hypothetical protein MK171_05550 [Pirellulales bacterium]|nr:hypothetical protein [Pirellulales bacterium]